MDLSSANVRGMCPSISGWLEKQADWRFSWDRRFVCLNKHVLSYKEMSHLPDKKSGKVLYLEAKLQQPRCFRVRIDNGESWTLRADTDDSYRQWVDALTNMLTKVEDKATDEGSWLQASVEKRGYWTHTWKNRFLMLNIHDGTLMYSAKEGEAPRGRTMVCGAELVLSCEERNEVAFIVSNGDNFHARFRTVDEAAGWVSSVHSLMVKTDGCRWLNVDVSSADPMLVSMGASPTPQFGFERIAHATFVLPGTDHLFVFGGRSSKGFSTKDPAVEPFTSVPPQLASSVLCSADVYHVRFTGDSIANTVHIAPFLEGASAKVRPLPREGCASAAVERSWVIYGGRGAGGSILDDVWEIDFSAQFSRGGGGSLCWRRLTDPVGASAMAGERKLPPLAFHSAVTFPISSPSSSAASCTGGSVLFTGGTEDGLRATDKCWLFDLGTCAVKELVPMDVPRAQHSSALLPLSNEIIVVGGVQRLSSELPNRIRRTIALDGVESSEDYEGWEVVTKPFISIRSPITGRWSPLNCSYVDRRTFGVNPMAYPSAAVVPSGTVPAGGGGAATDAERITNVIIMGGPLSSKELPQLVNLRVESPNISVPTSASKSTATLSVISAVGSCPSVPIGAPLLTFGNYLYSVGGEGLRKLLVSSIFCTDDSPVGVRPLSSKAKGVTCTTNTKKGGLAGHEGNVKENREGDSASDDGADADIL